MISSQNKKQIQQEEKKMNDAPKSEHGASTNLSQDTNENIDEEFKLQKGEKFEFINESVKDWPQWSVNSQEKPQQEQKVEPKIDMLKRNHDKRFMFNRGIPYPIRVQNFREQQAQKQAEKPKEKKKGTFSQLTSKIKNWFK